MRIGKPEPPKKGKGKKKKGKLAEEGQFICQDALSPYSVRPSPPVSLSLYSYPRALT